MYFKQRVDEAKAETIEKTKSPEGSETETEDDAFSKLKNQISRYFNETNPTIKCRNCKEFGHFARECPNERSRMNCILCGKDTHDSFECNEKLCFKCNKVGHKASECKETDVVKCLVCGQIGHQQSRCLKVWNPSNVQYSTQRDERRPASRFTKNHNGYKRCMECGNMGHFKCTSEKRSRRVNLTFDVADNLNEFFVDDSDEVHISTKDLASKREEKRHRKEVKKQRQRRLSNSNLMIPTTDDEAQSDESNSSSDREGREQEESQCPICAGKHDHEECRNKSFGNSRYMHYDNVRNRFAKDVGFNYKREQNNNRRYVDVDRLEVEERNSGWGRRI